MIGIRDNFEAADFQARFEEETRRYAEEVANIPSTRMYKHEDYMLRCAEITLLKDKIKILKSGLKELGEFIAVRQISEWNKTIRYAIEEANRGK